MKMTSELAQSPQAPVKVKRKRGRPPVMDTPEYLSHKQTWNNLIETRRGLLNKHYEIKGFGIVLKMQKDGITGLEYISDPIKQKNKNGILTELGHFDEEIVRILVPAICEAQKNPDTKRTVHEWGDFLRTYRLHPEVFEVLSETVSESPDDEEDGEDGQ
jgi:hypothetical protein